MEYFLIFLPLLGAIISGFFGRYIGDRNSEIITSLFVTFSAIISLIIFYEVIINSYENNLIISKWISSGFLDVNWSIKIDPLSSVMLVIVCMISSLMPCTSAITSSMVSSRPSEASLSCQALWCTIMLSIMVPSISKMMARVFTVVIFWLSPKINLHGHIYTLNPVHKRGFFPSFH